MSKQNSINDLSLDLFGFPVERAVRDNGGVSCIWIKIVGGSRKVRVRRFFVCYLESSINCIVVVKKQRLATVGHASRDSIAQPIIQHGNRLKEARPKIKISDTPIGQTGIRAHTLTLLADFSFSTDMFNVIRLRCTSTWKRIPSALVSEIVCCCNCCTVEE